MYEAGPGDSVKAWVVHPERRDRAPVVIVIHDITGLSDWSRAVGDQLAADGFIAIVPDLLTGKGPNGGNTDAFADRGAIGSAIRTLSREDIARRLNGAARFGTRMPNARDRVGTVGFCWGGGVSFSMAYTLDGIDAAVVYYGPSPADSLLRGVQSPVLGLYGGNDARINTGVPPAQAEMQRRGKRFDVETYEGAGHGFLRSQWGQNGANRRASEQAWPRTISFFRETLGR